jgi:hypothetical protein
VASKGHAQRENYRKSQLNEMVSSRHGGSPQVLLRFSLVYRTGSMRGIERSVALSPVSDTSAKSDR